MQLFRHHVRRLAWIALIAILGLSLAPTVSHALAGSMGQSPWTEVCTPDGPKVLADAGTGDESPGRASGHLEHCPLCALGGTTPVLPTQLAPMLPTPDLGATLPSLYLQAARTLFAWRPAQARAPPSLS